MAVAEPRKKTAVPMIRVKSHPICPHCGVVMSYNGRPSHAPRVTYYKCPMRWCGHTEKLFDAFVPLSDIPEADTP